MPDSADFGGGVVATITANCRRCYNCVRSCPAKAIRVQDGQACVIAERCIGCGNCVKVCAQKAKQVQPAIGQVRELLASSLPVVAILAPSYPAAYRDISGERVIGAIRALGFDRVLEVGFGAEMVAAEYAKLLRNPPDHPVITTPCPALVSYVCKHLPALVPYLAPIVSPMVALGKAVKQELLPGAAVVFIGPCIAKKAERAEPYAVDSIDAAMTFKELEDLWFDAGIWPTRCEPSQADPPLPHYGALFPVSGGLLKAAAVEADLMDDAIAVVEGPDRCKAALEALAEGEPPARFLDMLFCEGCIAGPGYSESVNLLSRKALVTAHVRALIGSVDGLRERLTALDGIALACAFEPAQAPLDMPTETEIRDILARTNKHGPQDELNCGACGYPSCREKAIAVYQGLAEPEMCLPYLIDQLEVNIQKLSSSKGEIQRVREEADRAQQLASMGELAADVAQEISNPLAKIAAFAQLLMNNLPPDEERRADLQTVIAEARQCRHVVAGLQAFARQREPQWVQADLGKVIEAAVAEIGPEAEDAGATLTVRVEEGLPQITADAGQLNQVIQNILINAVEAVGPGGEISVEASRRPESGKVAITIADNGRGIPSDLVPKLFQPFVTSKQDRPGSGLGLAVAHGIVLSHGGDIHLDSEPGAGTTVTVMLPLAMRPPVSRSAMKVLVVDDDPDFVEQHRLVLESKGFDVVTAERSDEALDVANREIPDAFLLDLMMERTDSGARLARALRRDPRFRTSPIIMLTSVVRETGFDFYKNPDEVLEWMKADAWFDKPAPFSELTETLERLLAERAAAAE